MWQQPHPVVDAHTQAPPMQVRPVPQARPHAPQLFRSFERFTQTLSHLVCPVAGLHTKLQLPAAQTAIASAGAVHGRHRPPHLTYPASQAKSQPLAP
jgi:hypothetical protein